MHIIIKNTRRKMREFLRINIFYCPRRCVMRYNSSVTLRAPHLVVRAVEKPHHSVTIRAGICALIHLALLKQWVSTV